MCMCFPFRVESNESRRSALSGGTGLNRLFSLSKPGESSWSLTLTGSFLMGLNVSLTELTRCVSVGFLSA